MRGQREIDHRVCSLCRTVLIHLIGKETLPRIENYIMAFYLSKPDSKHFEILPKSVPVFLFTDIEGSTEKWSKRGEKMSRALARHDAILKETLEKYQGRLISHTGDGIFAVFEKGDPLEFALVINKTLAMENWEEIGDLRIRIALHAGEAEERDGNFFGPVVNRTARILACGFGGQILLTPDAAKACRLPSGASLLDLGTHRLKDLEEPQPLFQLEHPDLPFKKFPPLRSLSSHPNNLPEALTPFVGRGKELHAISLKLKDSGIRMVTLLGPGGIGKTRFALQTASENLELFPDGIYFIPLDSLNDPNLILFSIAQTLPYTFQKGKEEKKQLFEFLQNKQLLLVLDNFEHFVTGSKLLSDILSAAPKVKILATSRESLNLQSETLFPLEGLPFPEHEKSKNIETYPAVQLFLQKAKQSNPNFILDEKEKLWVVEICRMTNGLPLGIELAASWVKILSCREIAFEIKKNIAFLKSQSRDREERHQSLQAVFEYSWQLLSQEEKEALKKLTVFRGGFQREAAEAIAQLSLPLLLSLTDKSFIKKTSSSRYEIHELLRKLAKMKLTENEKKKLEKHHAEYFFRFLSQKEKLLKSEKQKVALQEIREDFHNIQAAWERGIQDGKEALLEKCMAALYSFFHYSSSFREGIRFFEHTLKTFKKILKNRKKYLALLNMRLASLYGGISNFEKAEKLLN